MVTKRLLFAICIVFLVIGNTYGNSQKSVNATLDELARDLAGLQEELESYRVEQARTNRISGQDRKVLSGVQASGTYTFVVTKKETELRAEPSYSSNVSIRAPEGSVFKALERKDSWYAVEADQSGAAITGQSGTRASKREVLWVPKSDVLEVNISPQKEETPAEQIVRIIETVKRIYNKYKDNPYVRLTGFTVTLGSNPSVSFSFQFK